MSGGRPLRVSVVVPSLNQADYLPRALDSVLDQHWSDLELLVIDGGSADGTREVLGRYADRLAWWVSEPDGGQADALNRGLRRATGEVVVWLNSDDYLLPGSIAALVAPMSADPTVEWVAGRCRYEHASGALEEIVVPRRPQVPRRRLIVERWHVPQASSAWRRSLFERLGGLREDLHYVLDTELLIRFALHGVLPVVIDDEIAVRYLHADAKSAAPELFEAEYAERVVPDLTALLGTRDRAADVVYRTRRKVALRVGQARRKSPLS